MRTQFIGTGLLARLAPAAASPTIGAALCAVVVLLATAARPAAAHDLGFTRTVAVLLPEGAYRIDMQVDLDALALGMSQDTDNAALIAALDAMSADELEQTMANLQQTFLRRVRVRFDGEAVTPLVSFPNARSEHARSLDTVLGLTARLTGTVPPGASELTLQASRAFPPLHITFVDARDRAMAAGGLDEMLRIEPPATDEGTAQRQPPAAGGEARAGALQPGDEPPADALDERLGDLVTSRQILERGGLSDPYPLDRPPPQPSRLQVVGQYLWLGFEHILPLGIDHILFVLGLFLLNTAWRPLLAQVTAFTAAHTLTLAASTYGVVSLSPAIVEPLIALSIAWIAFENVVTDELHWWRPAVVFGFGLLHGLGFAGVLAELGLPRGEYLAALLSFNVGVELGQLTVIALAFLALGAFRRRDWYRPRLTVPASVLIGLIGLYWAFERTFTG